MNDINLHDFFEGKYKQLLQSKLGLIYKKKQLEVLHREICMVYSEETWKRPHALLREIEGQIC